MDRHVEFRGIDRERGVWRYGTLSQHIHSGDEFVGGIPVYPKTTGQFTGLLDHYYQKIYEGDILMTADGRYAYVQWHGIGFRIVAVPYKEGAPCMYGPGNVFEVVGNVVDNPEMALLLGDLIET